MKRNPLRRCWRNMLSRCYNPKHTSYAGYGGRGITVCDRWRESFESFAADMGPRPSPDHSIDRKDNDGSYSPENCRWATALEQNLNKRDNCRITYQGVTKTVAEWAAIHNMPRTTIYSRHERGWPADKIFTLEHGVGQHIINAAKTHCKRGHPFAGENLVRTKKGRGCRICRNASVRDCTARKKAKQADSQFK